MPELSECQILGVVVTHHVVPGHVQLRGLVTEGLELDLASLIINWVVGKVHWTSDVEVDSPIVSDHTVVIDSDRGRNRVKAADPRLGGLVDEDVRDPDIFGKS